MSFPTSAAESIELYKGTQPGPDDYVEGEICPLRFWANHAHKFPALAVLAEWVFGLPPTSTRSESLFSSAGGILTAKRSCLTPANAEILTFLWANVTPGDLTDLKPQ